METKSIPVPVGSQVTITKLDNPDSDVPTPNDALRVYLRRPASPMFEELPYKRRAAFTFCGNNILKAFTVTWIIMLAIGIAVQATSIPRCPDNCIRQECIDQMNREWPCTCGDDVCQDMTISSQAIAGICLIAVSIVAILAQALLACTCCLCWIPPHTHSFAQ